MQNPNFRKARPLSLLHNNDKKCAKSLIAQLIVVWMRDNDVPTWWTYSPKQSEWDAPYSPGPLHQSRAQPLGFHANIVLR